MTNDESNVVLSVNRIGRRFSRSQAGQRRLLASQVRKLILNGTPDHSSMKRDDFWALQDVSFDLHRGEVLGVIGFNGAGKSTLLRMLAGLILPDVGEIRATGKIGTLLELGAGMQPSLSGERNIFIKGALLGKSQAEMKALYPEIAVFSELGEFLSAPLATYSSGMRLRLGFAVAVHIQPDILLLDEILAVGDYAFKQKCRGRIVDMLDHAGVVFVSHSMNDVQQICDRVIVLDKGRIQFQGAPKDAIAFYHELAEKRARAAETGRPPNRNFYGETFHNTDRIADVEHFWSDPQGRSAKEFDTWKPAQYKVAFRLMRPARRLEVGLSVWTHSGFYVSGMATDMQSEDIFDYSCLEHELTLRLPKFSFNPGEYVTTIAIVDSGEVLYRGLNEPIRAASPIRFNGVVTPPFVWEANYAEDVQSEVQAINASAGAK